MLGAASVLKRSTAAWPQSRHRRTAAQLLARALRPFILRRTKEQVATRAARQDRADHLCELEPGPAQALRRAARPLPRSAAADASSERGPGQIEDAGARSAAAPAPGRLPSRPDRRKRTPTSPAPSSSAARPARGACSTRATRPWSSRSSPACWRIVRKRLDDAGHRLRVPRRQDAATARQRVEALPERPRLQAVPHQPEGRRPGPEPDRRRLRLPSRPLVEPGRRGAGHRPRPPHRPDAAGVRLPPDRPRHGRGEKCSSCRKTKRDLADAILSADNSLIRDLKREDLELLLS